MEKMWKQSVVTLFEVQFRKLPGETEESGEEYLLRIAGFRVEI